LAKTALEPAWLLEARGQIGLFFRANCRTRAIKPEYAMIAAVAKAVLQAMPNSWFENNDDYLDSFYTLEKNRTYTDYVGAANNAEITLTPYRLRDD
jgi:Protein of unknown function (DUF3103)